MVQIRTEHSQIGMSIYARAGGDWQLIQISKYKERTASPSVRQYSTCIDPARDEQEYYAQLDARSIPYERVRA
jgi:hypothetical protein